MSDKKKSINKNTWKKVMKHIRRYWFAVAMSLVLAAVTVVLTLYVPILTGEAVDLMIDKGLVDMPGILAILKKIAQTVDLLCLLLPHGIPCFRQSQKVFFDFIVNILQNFNMENVLV